MWLRLASQCWPCPAFGGDDQMTRTSARVFTSLVVFALCAELLGLFAYVDTGALFYTHRKSYRELLPTPEDRLFLGEAVHP